MSRRGLKLNRIAVALAVEKAGTSYSSAFPFEKCTGIAGVLIASTAGSITVTQQVSQDGVTFYDAVDSGGSAVGAVAATVTVTTGRWVSYSPVFTPYIRYKIVEGNVAVTAVTMTLVYQEEL